MRQDSFDIASILGKTSEALTSGLRGLLAGRNRNDATARKSTGLGDSGAYFQRLVEVQRMSLSALTSEKSSAQSSPLTWSKAGALSDSTMEVMRGMMEQMAPKLPGLSGGGFSDTSNWMDRAFNLDKAFLAADDRLARVHGSSIAKTSIQAELVVRTTQITIQSGQGATGYGAADRTALAQSLEKANRLMQAYLTSQADARRMTTERASV